MLQLVDTSAWHRSAHVAVAAAWTAALDADELATCPQIELEVLYSARSSTDYDEVRDELRGLHRLDPPGVFARALEVQHLLAHVGGLHHRSVKIADLLIAATAELAGAVVLHYDEDFDRIAACTGQPTKWIAPRGSL